MLIRKQEKRPSDTPLKWLRYLGIAMVIVIALYYGIRVLDQIKEDQDVETLDVGIHSKSDRESGNDDTSNIAFIDLIHTEDLEVISFIAFQRRFDLNLTPMKHQMISEGARIRKSDTNEIDGYINETNAFKQCEFYHAVNPAVSAALWYCEKRGFWGRITADHGIYDIEKVDGDRHRISLVDVEREMEEWRANVTHRGSVPLHGSNADQLNIARRLSGTHSPKVRADCAEIELLIIQLPTFRAQYDADPEELLAATLSRVQEAWLVFRNTAWIRNGEEFICFDLTVGEIIEGTTDMECGKDIDTKDKITEYVDGRIAEGTRTFDVAYAFRDSDGGLTTTGTICSDKRYSVAVAGTKGFIGRTMAHELGHLLGANHDHTDPCLDDYGGDFGFVMGYAAHDHHVEPIRHFSQCTQDQVYDEWRKGNLLCLFNKDITGSNPDYSSKNEQCGTGRLPGLEKCAEGTDQCCEMNACERIQGCCITGNECEEACNENFDWTQIPKMISITGATIHEWSHSVTRGNGNLKVDLNGAYLRHANGKCYRGMPYFLKSYLRLFYDPGVRQWFVSHNGVGAEHLEFAKCVSTIYSSSQHQDLFSCTAGEWKFKKPLKDPPPDSFSTDAGMSITKNFIVAWRCEDPQRDCLSFAAGTSNMITRRWESCLDIHTGWIPDTITIAGAASSDNINGAYSRIPETEACASEMPSFKKVGLRIVYDLIRETWLVSDYSTGEDPSILAECMSTNVTEGYQNLLSCTRGKWTTDDGNSRDGTMKIEDLQGSVCDETPGMILDKVFIVGAPVNDVNYNLNGVYEKEKVYGSEEYIDCNGWRSILMARYMMVGGPFAIHYNVQVNGRSNAKWTVYKDGTYPKEILAQCETVEVADITNHERNWGGRQLQDLRRCTEGEWQLFDALFTVPTDTGINGLHNALAMTIGFSKSAMDFTWHSSPLDPLPAFEHWIGSPTGSPSTGSPSTGSPSTGSSITVPPTIACDECLDWDGMHGSTISIGGAPAPLNANGQYTRSENPDCIGGMPYFTKDGSSNLRIIYDSVQEKWFVSSFDLDDDQRTDHAYCDNNAQRRGYQDLRKCTGGKWRSLNGNEYHDMRIKHMSAMKNWFIPKGGMEPCATIPEKAFEFVKVFWAVFESQFGRDVPQNVPVNVNNEAESYYNEHFESIHAQTWPQFQETVQGRCLHRGEMCSVGNSVLYGCEQTVECSGILTNVKTKLNEELTNSCSLNLDDCDGNPQTGRDNVWKNFWNDASTIFGGKQDKVRKRARKYAASEDVSWDQVKSHMKSDACDHTDEMYTCWFVESLFYACDQLTNWCGRNEKKQVIQSINDGLTRHCDWGTKFECSDVTAADGSEISVIVGTGRSIFGQTDSKGDGFWSNHVYVGLIAVIVLLMLGVCRCYYLRNRRNQQQTANEGNPAEHVRPDEQDAVNDLSIEDVEDYKQEMDKDGENGARPNGESQPAVDRVAHSNSVVAISLKYRN